jgi:ribosomal protein S4
LQIHPKKVEFFKKFLELNAQPRVPSWLEWNEQTMTATVTSLPHREENDTPVNMQLIVEFYSR